MNYPVRVSSAPIKRKGKNSVCIKKLHHVLSVVVSDVPVCSSAEPVVYGVGKGEMVDVFCDVVANPASFNFQWSFNNSADFIRVPPSRVVVVNGTRYVGNSTRSRSCYTGIFPVVIRVLHVKRLITRLHIVLYTVIYCASINSSAVRKRRLQASRINGDVSKVYKSAVRQCNSASEGGNAGAGSNLI